ncbi:MAG TPA: hypothetical protein VFE53_12455 [Mucilaginibacter sp.]|jgi:hypothetical protein|nr:hypothetical protein [Mucilaginibacter sp.]
MKWKSCAFLLLITCILWFNSCLKNDALSDPQTTATNISLKFGGYLYTSSTAVAVYKATENTISIGGAFGSVSYVNLIVPGVHVGTFDLSGGNASLSFQTGTNVPDNYVSISGSVTVTEFTPSVIEGTFQFTGVDSLNVSRQITEGQFITGYTTQ